MPVRAAAIEDGGVALTPVQVPTIREDHDNRLDSEDSHSEIQVREPSPYFPGHERIIFRKPARTVPSEDDAIALEGVESASKTETKADDANVSADGGNGPPASAVPCKRFIYPPSVILSHRRALSLVLLLTVTPTEVKRVLKKIDKYIMPLFGLIYMLQCERISQWTFHTVSAD